MSLAQPAGPRGEAVACAACGDILDALRAGHVSIFDGQFHFFCDAEYCRVEFLSRARSERREGASELPRESAVRGAPAVSPRDAVPLPEVHQSDDGDDLIEPLDMTPVVQVQLPSSGVSTARSSSEVGMLLFALTALAAGMATALELAENSNLVLLVRVVLLSVSSATLGARVLSWPGDPAKPTRLVAVSAPLLAVLVAMWALLFQPVPFAARACFLAGVVLLVSAATLWLVVWAEGPVTAWRAWAEARLAVPSGSRAGYGARSVLTGEPLTLEAGEIVPVDMVVTNGEGEVSTWWSTVLRVQKGDVVVAGGRLRRGRVSGSCIAAGSDRTLLRSFAAPARRADVHAPWSRWARRVAEVGAVCVAIIGSVLFMGLGWSLSDAMLIVVGVYAAFANVVLGSLPGLVVAKGGQRALSRGVVYGSAEAWRRCSYATTAVFCARGTLLRGEPELVESEVVPERTGLGDSEDGLLGLAAAALSGQQDPCAVAIRRAAASRNLVLEAVRNPRRFGGQGVTAVAPSGEALCVGTRSLMIERGVSVAVAERRVHELETRGRSTILVAREGRLVGLLAVQDGLRAGARAAVQHVSDVGIEPILVSPDTRETCEALGRALDIDHLRPEADDPGKVEVVRRLQDAGGRVAVIGHSPNDDDALKAAYTPVVMQGVGKLSAEHVTRIVSDDVRDASLALVLAHHTRRQAQVVLGVLLTGAIVGALAVSVGFLPAEYAPIASMLSALIATRFFRKI